MIAGGIGIVPFCILAMRCQAVSIRQRLLFGGRSEKDLPGLEDFKKQNIDIVVSTDDGSVGKKGVVTELLKKELSKRGNPVVYACGPNGMLKEIARMTKKSGVPCYVSLESVMACGIGACLGCAVKVKGQKNISDFGPPLADRISDLKSYIPYPTSQIYKMVCKDGPVFNAEEIVWEEL